MIKYNLQEQYSLDINWYFTDMCHRKCVAISAGGVLPYLISEDLTNNNFIHQLIMDLPEGGEIITNSEIGKYIHNIDIDHYLKAFIPLAMKGLYVYDRINLENAEDTTYILVACPSPNSAGSKPLANIKMSACPRIHKSIIKKLSTKIYPSSFQPVNLNDLLQ